MLAAVGWVCKTNKYSETLLWGESVVAVVWKRGVYNCVGFSLRFGASVRGPLGELVFDMKKQLFT